MYIAHTLRAWKRTDWNLVTFGLNTGMRVFMEIILMMCLEKKKTDCTNKFRLFDRSELLWRDNRKDVSVLGSPPVLRLI